MPDQCPECARFLSKDLVSSLATAPAPCPQCETTLTAEMFREDAVTDEATATHEDPSGDRASVRPPDLAPGAVSDGPDPLAGWDQPVGADVVELSRWRRDHRGLDTEAVAAVAAGAGLVGALIGALTADRRGRGALLGALLAAIAGVVGVSTTRR